MGSGELEPLRNTNESGRGRDGKELSKRKLREGRSAEKKKPASVDGSTALRWVREKN